MTAVPNRSTTGVNVTNPARARRPGFRFSQGQLWPPSGFCTLESKKFSTVLD